MPSHDPRAVANAVLDWADTAGISVTQLKLHKVLYYCHAHWLVEFNQPLITHDFQAWEYGPALKIVHDSFRHNRNRPITDRAIIYDVFEGSKRIAPYSFTNNERELLNTCLSKYLPIPTSDLVDMSHMAGGPWHSVWTGQPTTPNMKIPNSLIHNYFIRDRII